VQRRYSTCFSCGIKVESSSEDPPCEILSGWLTVSHWRGLEAVEHYNFCSFTCLKKWVEVQTPEIPNVFLQSFDEEQGGGSASP